MRSTPSAFLQPLPLKSIPVPQHHHPLRRPRTTFSTVCRTTPPSTNNQQSQKQQNQQKTEKRGFQLFRSDLNRLSNILQDWRNIFPSPPNLLRYDVNTVTSYYDARPIPVLFRAAAVGLPFLAWLFRVRSFDKWRGVDKDPAVTKYRAEQLRTLLTWAGPTYLKIGQAVGNRPDLVGPVYSAELQKLVDQVGSFDSDVAVDIVKAELGLVDLTQIFDRFDREAIASASLGQVHHAILKHSGEEVAIKVQRPRIDTEAVLDVYILRCGAALAKKKFKLRSDLVGIVDEFATRLWEELDYCNEADNCERFGKLYADKDVCVPKIYRQFTSKRVLCMEWIDGDKAPWFPPSEGKRLIRLGVKCSLQQLLDDGFVHADPHTGNLFRTKDGKLCYLDFGMCVQVPKSVKYDLIAAIARLINRDYKNLAPDFVKLGFLPSGADTQPVAELLEKAFGDASSGGALSELSFSKLADNLASVAFQSPIRLPVFFTLIIRSLTILEGFALQTDESFKIVDEAYPYVVSRILKDDVPVFQDVLRGILIDSETGRLKWKRFQSLLETKSSTLSGGSDTNNSMNGKVVAHATGEGSRSGWAPNILGRSPVLGMRSESEASTLSEVNDLSLNLVVDFILSDRGSFLRRALQIELADTADAAQLAFLKRVSDASNGLLPAPTEDVDVDRLEKAIAIAQILRTRFPDLLSLQPPNGSEDILENRERQKLFRTRLSEISREVTGDIVDRNARRFLRKTIAVIFGDSNRDRS